MPGGTQRGYSIRKVITNDEVFAEFLAAKVTAEYLRKGGLASTILGPAIAPPKLEKVA